MSLKLLTSLTLVLFSSALTLQAAVDSTDIELNLDVPEYVNIIGTVVGASKYYTADEIGPTVAINRGDWITLGTLGFESNNSGDCDVEFSTQNNFRLRHTVTNQRLTNYRLRYEGSVISRTRNQQNVYPCNLAASDFEFQKIGAFWRENTQDGVYQDTVTITISTQ